MPCFPARPGLFEQAGGSSAAGEDMLLRGERLAGRQISLIVTITTVPHLGGGGMSGSALSNRVRCDFGRSMILSLRTYAGAAAQIDRSVDDSDSVYTHCNVRIRADLKEASEPIVPAPARSPGAADSTAAGTRVGGVHRRQPAGRRSGSPARLVVRDQAMDRQVFTRCCPRSGRTRFLAVPGRPAGHRVTLGMAVAACRPATGGPGARKYVCWRASSSTRSAPCSRRWPAVSPIWPAIGCCPALAGRTVRRALGDVASYFYLHRSFAIGALGAAFGLGTFGPCRHGRGGRVRRLAGAVRRVRLRRAAIIVLIAVGVRRR